MDTVFSNGKLVIADLQKSNILRDVDGNIRVIDADVRLHNKDIGGKYEYPDPAADTEIRFRLADTSSRTPSPLDYNQSMGAKRYAAQTTANTLGVEVSIVPRKDMPQGHEFSRGIYKNGTMYLLWQSARFGGRVDRRKYWRCFEKRWWAVVPGPVPPSAS